MQQEKPPFFPLFGKNILSPWTETVLRHQGRPEKTKSQEKSKFTIDKLTFPDYYKDR